MNKRGRQSADIRRHHGSALPGIEGVRASYRADTKRRSGSVRLHAFGEFLKATMITISKEDYLKAIAEAEAEGQTVIPATLAHWLSVTRPAVTFALKRLRKDGLVSIKKEGQICLTSQGREIAERTMVRHHLIERMLSEMFGMAWYEIHDEAERLEHAVSPAFEKKLVERLGHKDTCPHGNALALRSPADRRKRGLRLLSEAEAGLEVCGCQRLRARPKALGIPRERGTPSGRSRRGRSPKLRRNGFLIGG